MRAIVLRVAQRPLAHMKRTRIPFSLDPSVVVQLGVGGGEQTDLPIRGSGSSRGGDRGQEFLRTLHYNPKPNRKPHSREEGADDKRKDGARALLSRVCFLVGMRDERSVDSDFMVDHGLLICGRRS